MRPKGGRRPDGIGDPHCRNGLLFALVFMLAQELSKSRPRSDLGVRLLRESRHVLAAIRATDSMGSIKYEDELKRLEDLMP